MVATEMTSIQEAVNWVFARHSRVVPSGGVQSQSNRRGMESWIPPVVGLLAAAVVITVCYIIYRYRNHIRYCNYKQSDLDNDEIDIVDLYVSKSPQAKIYYPNSPEFVIPVTPYCPQKPYRKTESLASPLADDGLGTDQAENGTVYRKGRRSQAVRMSTVALQSELDLSMYTDGAAGELAGLSTIHSRGRLHLAVLHDVSNLCVIVNILGATDVNFDDRNFTTVPDTCLKVRLVQKSRQSTDQLQCSRIYTNLAPKLKYDASFCFFVTDKMRPKKTYVVVSLNTVDRFSRMTEVGQVCMLLSDIEAMAGTGRVLDAWRDVIPASVVLRSYGELMVSLSHQSADSLLTACVIEGRKLIHPDNQSDNDEGVLYVSVAMLSKDEMLRRRRSSTQSLSARPEFNEEYKFDFTSYSLSSVTLVFTVFSRDSKGRNRMLGKMNVGSMAYAFGTGLEHWTAMIANPNTAVRRWHALL